MDLLLPVDADDRLPFGEPFTIAQALERGVTERVLQRLTRRGVLRRVFRGVYVDSAADDDLLMRAKALSLVVPPTAVVTDECAAWARGIDLVARGDHVIPPPVMIVQPHGRGRVRKHGTDGRRRLLLPRDVETLHRIEESAVRSEVEKAGFKLAAEADFLRAPDDTRDWSASPRVAGEKRGTSDRFVLRYVKP